MKLVDQNWRPNAITFTKEVWEGLHTGAHPHWIVQDDHGDVIAIVFDPTDKDKDSLYAASIARFPEVIQFIDELFNQEDISEEKYKELRRLVELIKTI